MGKSKEEDKDGRDIHYSNLKECINNINGNADNTDFNVTVTDGTNLDKNPPVGAVATLPQKQKKSKKNKNLIN